MQRNVLSPHSEYGSIYSCTQNVEDERSFKTSVNTYQSIRHHIPADGAFHMHRPQDLKYIWRWNA